LRGGGNNREPNDDCLLKEGGRGVMSSRKAIDTTDRRFTSRLSLALAIGVAVLLGTEQAQAQTTVTKTTTKNQSFTRDVGDPCTGETVHVQGTEDTTFQSQQGATQFQSKVDDRQQGSGVGLATGAQYSFSNFTSNTFKSSTATFTARFTVREHLFRNGNTPPVPKDDFFVRVRSRIDFTNGDPNGPTTETFASEACK
jgi:hypothetical protein